MSEEEQREKIKSIVAEYMGNKPEKKLSHDDYSELLKLFKNNHLVNSEGSLLNAFLQTLRMPSIDKIFDKISKRRAIDDIRRFSKRALYIESILDIYSFLDEKVINNTSQSMKLEEKIKKCVEASKVGTLRDEVNKEKNNSKITFPKNNDIKELEERMNDTVSVTNHNEQNNIIKELKESLVNSKQYIEELEKEKKENDSLKIKISELEESKKYKVSINEYNEQCNKVKDLEEKLRVSEKNIEKIKKEKAYLEKINEELEKQRKRAVDAVKNNTNENNIIKTQQLASMLKIERENNKQLTEKYKRELNEKDDKINEANLLLREYDNAIKERDRIIEEQKKSITQLKNSNLHLKCGMTTSIRELENKSSAISSNINEIELSNPIKEVKVESDKFNMNSPEIITLCNSYNQFMIKYRETNKPIDFLKQFVVKYKLNRRKCNNINDILRGKIKIIELQDDNNGAFLLKNIGESQLIFPQPEGRNAYNKRWQDTQKLLYDIKVEPQSTDNIIRISEPAIISSDGRILQKGKMTIS